MSDKTDNNNSLDELIKEGDSFYSDGNYKEAIKNYKIAFIMSKNISKNMLGMLYIKLANSYYNLSDLDKYSYYYEEYLKDFPKGQMSIFSRLAQAYYNIDINKSIDYHNKALNIEVNKYDSASKLFNLLKSSFYSQSDIKDESEYEAEQIKNKFFKNIKKYSFDNKKSQKNKKLNIGYLSSDCYAHTMMNYMIPIWENHNQNEFNFFIFNCSTKVDSITEKIKNIGFKMFDCANMPEEELANLIYRNDIDILVDVGGYTHLKSYVHFYKPAPVIISYLGYLNTLGIKEVDYILTDKFSIPENTKDLYTEKPLYINNYQIFTEKNLPELTEAPFKTNGYITFASFNCTSKISDLTIYMWAKLLKELPNSKLLIYRTQLTKRIIKCIKEKLEKRGAPMDRVSFNSHKFDTHFFAYNQADISLDPYPFNGMSIAIETALMGVPTVTLLGEGLQSRGTGRINHILGLDDLIASDGDEYVKIAVSLANNPSKIEFLRKNLRDKVNNSIIRQNASDFTKELENSFEFAWNEFIQT